MLFQTQLPIPNYTFDPDSSAANIPAKMSVQSQLMQNYTIPSNAAKGYATVAVGLDRPFPSWHPQTHVFAVKSADASNIDHFSYAVSNGTMWSKQAYKLPNQQAVMKLTTGQEANGRLVVFALTTNNQLFYRRVSDHEWTLVNVSLPTASDVDSCDMSAGLIDDELCLGITYDMPNSQSAALWVDWENQTKQTAVSGYKRINGVSVGRMILPGDTDFTNGMLIGCQHVQNDHGLVQFIPYGPEPQSPYSFRRFSSVQFVSVAISPHRPSEFVALARTGALATYEHNQWTQLLTSAAQFCLSGADADGDANIATQVYAVSDDNKLLRTYKLEPSPSDLTPTWSEPIVLNSHISAADIADNHGYLELFAISSADVPGQLIEIDRSPGSSSWHSAPLAVPTTARARDGRTIAVGYDQMGIGGPPRLNLFRVKSDGKIRRYVQTDPVYDIWRRETYSLPNNRQASQIVTTQSSDGRIIAVCLDTTNALFRREVGEVNWTRLESAELAGATSLVIAAGLTEVGSKIFVGINRGSNSRVYMVDAEGDPTAHWEVNSESYLRIYSISLGRAEAQSGQSQEGIYVSGFLHAGVGEIHWYPAGNPQGTYAPRYGDGIPQNHYPHIQGSSTENNVVFAIEDISSQHAQYLYQFSDQGRLAILPEHQIHHFTVVPTAPQDVTTKYHLFALTQNSVLLETTQNVDGTWTPAVEVDSARTHLASASVLLDDNKRVSAVADMGGGYLQHYMQRSDGWDAADVTYTITTTGAEPTPFQSFVTQITIGDNNGVAAPNAAVYLLPNDGPISVSVNHVSYRLDPDDYPLQLITDAQGKATCTVLATDLTTTQLLAWTDFMDQDDAVLIQPNGSQQELLATIPKQDLRDAQKCDDDGNETPLFTNPSVVTDDFMHSLHDAMQMSEDTTAKQTAAPAWLHRTASHTARRVARHDARRHAYLPYNEAGDRHFKIVFGHGKPGAHRHTRLSRLEAAAEFERMRRQHPSYAVAEELRFDGSFGDLMHASLDGSIQINEIVTSEAEVQAKVGDKLRTFFNAMVEFVVDTVTYVWEGVVEFVKETFDLVSALFADVQVAFDDLFDWLGDYFGWQDILNTQTYLKRMMLAILQTIPEQMVIKANDLGNWFETKNPQIPNPSQLGTYSFSPTADPINETVELTQALQLLGGVNAMTLAEDSDLPMVNWLLDQLSAVLNSFDFAIEMEAAVRQAALDFLNEFVNIVVEYGVELGTELTVLAETLLVQQGEMSLDEMFRLAIDSTRSIIETIAEAVVSGVVSAANAATIIINAAIAMCETKLDIPFISDLYKMVINPGHRLTVIDLYTLLGALPGTRSYKLITRLQTGRSFAPVIADESERVSDYQVTLNTPISESVHPEADMTDIEVGITSYLLRMQATSCVALSGIITVFEDQVEAATTLSTDDLDLEVARDASVDVSSIDTESLSPMTDTLDWIDFFAGLFGQTAYYPIGWDEESTSSMLGYNMWFGEYIFSIISLAELTEPFNVPEDTYDVLTSIFGVLDCMGIIVTASAQAADLDPHSDPLESLATMQWVLATSSWGLGAVLSTIEIAKPHVITAIATSFSPAAAMAAVGIYDIVTLGTVVVLDATATVLQLVDMVESPTNKRQIEHQLEAAL